METEAGKIYLWKVSGTGGFIRKIVPLVEHDCGAARKICLNTEGCSKFWICLVIEDKLGSFNPFDTVNVCMHSNTIESIVEEEDGED